MFLSFLVFVCVPLDRARIALKAFLLRDTMGLLLDSPTFFTVLGLSDPAR